MDCFSSGKKLNKTGDCVQRIAAGDRQAFEMLYHQYARRLAAYLARVLWQTDQVEDVLHDVLLAVWQQAGRTHEHVVGVHGAIELVVRDRAFEPHGAAEVERFGANVETIRTAPHADFLSPLRDLSDDERAIFERHIERFYRTFLSIVAHGRKLDVAVVEAEPDDGLKLGRSHVRSPHLVPPRRLPRFNVPREARGRTPASTRPLLEELHPGLFAAQELGDRFGARGDFAQAYVIAHEVGHHVQKLLGVARISEPERGARGSAVSVRRELQAMEPDLPITDPQTVGEIRTRTSRLFEFLDLRHVEVTLQALMKEGRLISSRPLVEQTGASVTQAEHTLGVAKHGVESPPSSSVSLSRWSPGDATPSSASWVRLTSKPSRTTRSPSRGIQRTACRRMRPVTSKRGTTCSGSSAKASSRNRFRTSRRGS